MLFGRTVSSGEGAQCCLETSPQLAPAFDIVEGWRLGTSEHLLRQFLQSAQQIAPAVGLVVLSLMYHIVYSDTSAIAVLHVAPQISRPGIARQREYPTRICCESYHYALAQLLAVMEKAAVRCASLFPNFHYIHTVIQTQARIANAYQIAKRDIREMT